MVAALTFSNAASDFWLRPDALIKRPISSGVSGSSSEIKAYFPPGRRAREVTSARGGAKTDCSNRALHRVRPLGPGGLETAGSRGPLAPGEFHRKHRDSGLETHPFHRQHPNSGPETRPFHRQHPNSAPAPRPCSRKGRGSEPESRPHPRRSARLKLRRTRRRTWAPAACAWRGPALPPRTAPRTPRARPPRRPSGRRA